MFARHSWTNRASRALLAMMALAVSLIGPARGQRIKYCSADGQAAVIFLSDNAGTFTDGAVDTGMGVYKPYTDCKWVIKPVINEQRDPINHRVVLHFEYLNIEAGFDFLNVFETNEAGKLLGQFTGSTLPPSLVAQVDTIFVRFQTDGTGQRLGFKARWDTLGCPNACGNRGSCVRDFCYCDEGYFGGDCSYSFCVGTKRYTSIIGNMMDHYRVLDEEDNLVLGPDNYRNNVDCRWLLAPLRLFAPYFTLEFLLMDSEIGRDLLIVYDGPNQNAPVLGQMSGKNITMPLLASGGGNLFLQFTSDTVKNNLGFFAFWDTMKECGGPNGFCMDGGPQALDPLPRPKQGYCFDTQYYPRQHAEKGRCLCHFGWYGGDCSFKWCLGAKTLTKRIGTFVDHHDEYKMIDNINTPIATKDYRASSFCRWLIQPLDPVNFIVLSFEYFDLESGSDFLFVHDGDYFDGKKTLKDFNHNPDALDGTLTGDGAARMPGQVLLSSNSKRALFLNFQTDDANTKSHLGFKANYEGVFCYGQQILRAASGAFTDGSPTAARYYPRSYCQWLIQPNEEHFTDHRATIQLQIARINVGLDLVTIYDGPFTNNTILDEFTGKVDRVVTLTASSRSILVEFRTLCHSGPKCRKCKKNCMLNPPHGTSCCDECLYCNQGRAPAGIGMNLYQNNIPEHEFLNENCMCDLIPPTNAGFKMSYVIAQETKFCRTDFPTRFKHWNGEFWGFAGAITYRNHEDCSWYIDVDPATAGGYKVEKMDIYLERMNVDEGRGVGKHPNPDTLTIYKGHNRTTMSCYDKCVYPVGVKKWENCPTVIKPQPHQPSCVLSSQSGNLIQCDETNIWTYHISCWSSPYHWTVDYNKVRIDFMSSKWFVGGNFKLRWQAEVTSPASSVVYGLGTVTTIAGELAQMTLQARWIDKDNLIQNRTTGGADVTMQFRYSMMPENATIFSQAVDNGDGTYHLQYTPKYAGVHTLYVQAFGRDVAGSPFTVVVRAGKIDPTKCKAYDTKKVDISDIGGLTGGKAGREYAFAVQCYDEFGNIIASASPITPAFQIQLHGLQLFWGWCDDLGDGTFLLKYNVPVAGEYSIVVLFNYNADTKIAIEGSPFPMTITKVTCPIVGEPPCNGQGTCLDTGVCVCNSGYDGEYCQIDLAKWLRMGIVIENAAVGTFVFFVIFSYIWQKCVRDKMLFERLAHDDTEEGW